MPTAIEMRVLNEINTIAGGDAPIGAVTKGRFHQDPLHFLQYILKTCKTGVECPSAASLHTLLAAAAATAMCKS